MPRGRRTVRTSPDGFCYAVVDGGELSARRARRIVAQGLGVEVVRLPPGRESLDFLEPVLNTLPRLLVHAWDCHDPSAVERAEVLTELTLAVESRTDVDLRTLPRLQTFAGEWTPHVASVLEHPGVTRLSLVHADPAVLTGRLAGIDALRLDSPRGRHMALDELGAVKATSVDVRGVHRLDLGDALTSVERLHLRAVGVVGGAAAVAEAGRLTELTVEECSRVDDLHLLLDVPGLRRFRLRGPRHLDDRWLTILARRPEVDVDLPPELAARLPKDRRAAPGG